MSYPRQVTCPNDGRSCYVRSCVNGCMLAGENTPGVVPGTGPQPEVEDFAKSGHAMPPPRFKAGDWVVQRNGEGGPHLVGRVGATCLYLMDGSHGPIEDFEVANLAQQPAPVPSGDELAAEIAEQATADVRAMEAVMSHHARADAALNRLAADATAKPTNSKDAIGSGKLPLHLWPATATAMGCVGLANGALKYGRSNFREFGVRASIYVDACKRHIDAWFEGEEVDPDDGVPHLSAALACLAIIVDAEAAGKLNDDRNVQGGYRALVDRLTAHIPRLKTLHADKAPKHFTIADNEGV